MAQSESKGCKNIMRKIDKIDGCFHCPLQARSGFARICSHPETEGMLIELHTKIPDWCPLPEDNPSLEVNVDRIVKKEASR